MRRTILARTLELTCAACGMWAWWGLHSPTGAVLSIIIFLYVAHELK